MKRIILACMVVLAFGTTLSNAQQFQLRGLEIYNPYYHNPAYVQAEKTVQLDFIGYNFYLNSGMWTSAITSLPKIHSSAGINFTRNSYTDVGNFWGLQLTYAYQHSFSEDLHLSGGIMFNSGHVNYVDSLFITNQEELSERHSGKLGLGISVEFKKLHAGLSTSLPLYARKVVVLLGDGTTESQKEDIHNSSYHFIAGYSFGKPRRLTLDPVFGLDYYYYNQNNSQYDALKGYLGANLEIRNVVGLGFTMGNLVSFSTSFSIMDRVKLILGIYAGEHELFGHMNSADYTIGSKEFDIIGQIRVNL